MLKKHTSPPFPQALHGKKGIRNASEILEVLRQVKVNIPLLDMIKQVPTYAKFLKDLCTIKRGLNVNKKAFLTEQVSAIIQCKSPLKYKDPGCPTISVMIGGKVVEKALLDLGASVNLLPYSVYKQLGLGELKPTSITLSLADRSVKIPRGNGLMQLTFGNMTLELNIFYMSKKQITPEEEEGPEEVCIIDTLVEEHCNQNMQDKLNESLGILKKGCLNPLMCLLLYKEKCLLEVLKRCKKAIGWQISDLKGISPLRWCELRAEATSSRYYLPISDSPWVSPTQVVPKKSGITVVQNEKGEEITTRLTSVLERVSGHPFYCFLDGYSGYFQIEIDVEDQEKTTFTCPFGTYAYRRMPFGLCNAPATFQRCMLSIFSDMVERIMEVFMDDITIYGGTFEECLVNLEAVLKDALRKTWCSTGRNAILWYIKELSLAISSPRKALKLIKQSDFAIGAVLGQREDGKPYVIYYASKTLNEAQRNYTTTEKELLADKKGVENVVADHLSSEWKAQDRKHFFAKIHAYYWEEPFLFKYCADQIIRKCVPEEEQQGILSHCHESACGGHFASQKTAMKCCNQGLLGHHFSKMPTSCVGAVIDAKGLGS
ncbi:Retrovirus-related Pol polyprotein from transposon 297 [Vitis vinifera]|uniref:Retrovirus-related Pol polyprotein from transposon 297 n=1 Tax=Vitis vinifera TaxID=29760 RepID=A0A438FWQ4_VITVI|nr:Retrovirus-related Pol polyprotein from transposon 297 [Vitis vinifera]